MSISDDTNSPGVYIKSDAGYWSNDFGTAQNSNTTMVLSDSKKDKFIINTIRGLEVYIKSASPTGKYLQWVCVNNVYSIINSGVDAKLTWDQIPADQDKLPLSFYCTFIQENGQQLPDLKLQIGASTGFNLKRVYYINTSYIEAVGYENSVFSTFSQSAT